MAIVTFKDLDVWQKSMQLVKEIYRLTNTFPDEEKYGLVGQMRRCCISIPSNIAEGHRRGSRKDYARFVSMAYGSSAELETQIDAACLLNYCADAEVIGSRQLLDDVSRMLNKLRQSLM